METQSKDNSILGWSPTREEMNDWLRTQLLCTLSTLDETGAPMAATVAFSVTEFGDILVGTSETSRKSHNVDHDDRVAIAVTDPERRITVQMQGTARKIAQAAFELDYAAEHYRERPESLPFRDEPGQTHILISPHHIRFSDCRPFPWVITEFTGS